MNTYRRFDAGLSPLAELMTQMDNSLRPFDPFFEWSFRHDSVDPTFTLPLGKGWSKDALNLRFSMPAVTEKDFSLQIQGRSLLLRGQRQVPEGFTAEGRGTFGLPYGRFEKVVELPEGLDLNRMKAQLHHGVLDIKIPYLEEAEVRAVPIHTGLDLPVAAMA